MSPSQGPIAGGTVVTVKGGNFVGTTVKLDGNRITPLSRSDTEIQLRAPKHNNGYAVISVRQGAEAAYGEFLYVPPRLDEIPPGFITTVAGAGAFARDYGVATAASIGVWGLEFDHRGNLYVADAGGGRVRRVRTDGTIELAAGGSTGPDIGDDGPALDAFLVFPRDTAVDADDNLYIGGDACRVRKVNRDGIITTFAGNGDCGFSGDNGLATAARIGVASFLTADTSDLFFIDYDLTTSAVRIRRVHFADGTISTFAGNGAVGFTGDGGPATQASFNLGSERADAGAITLDPDGNLYIADTGNGRIRRIDRHSGIIATFYVPTPGNLAQDAVGAIRSLAADRTGNVYYGGSGRIVKLSPTGQFVASWGNGTYALPVDGASAITSGLGFDIGLAIDAAGNIVYSDSAIGRVRRINVATGLLETLAGIGPQIIGENGPALATIVGGSGDLAIAPTGELLIGDQGTFRLRRLERDGTLKTIGGTGSQIGLQRDGVAATETSLYPVGVKVDSTGAIDVTQPGTIFHIDPKGLIVLLGGRDGTCGYEGDNGVMRQARFCQQWDTARDRDGNLFIADTNNNRIRRADARTNVVTTVVGNGGPVNGNERYGAGQSCGDGGLAINACINTPYGIVFDDVGNLYIAEQSGIRRVDAGGVISTFATIQAPSGLGGVTKLALHQGALFFGNGGIFRIDPSGVMTRIAGSSHDPLIGDGGPAMEANVIAGGQAIGVAIDDEGNLFFGDAGNNRIRAVRYGGVMAPVGSTIQLTASGSNLRATVIDAIGRPIPSV
ncbi:MAG TPA: IPT/TIG domain-containing protein, partial [Thermoanaerobaculia bacterium]